MFLLYLSSHRKKCHKKIEIIENFSVITENVSYTHKIIENIFVITENILEFGYTKIIENFSVIIENVSDIQNIIENFSVITENVSDMQKIIENISVFLTLTEVPDWEKKHTLAVREPVVSRHNRSPVK